MSWILKQIGKLLPSDKCIRCGVGPFSLPVDHPFTRACALHDYDFDQAHAGTPEKTRAEADKQLFWRWALIANNAPTAEESCNLMRDICKYWPLARDFGGIWWEGKE